MECGGERQRRGGDAVELASNLQKVMGCNGHRQPVRLVVTDRKFLVRIVFFSYTKLANSNNLRSYTIVSAPAEQADCHLPKKVK